MPTDVLNVRANLYAAGVPGAFEPDLNSFNAKAAAGGSGYRAVFYRFLPTDILYVCLIDNIRRGRFGDTERAFGGACIAAPARYGDACCANVHVVAVDYGIVGALLKGHAVEFYCGRRSEFRSGVGLVGHDHTGARKVSCDRGVGNRKVVRCGPFGI